MLNRLKLCTIVSALFVQIAGCNTSESPDSNATAGEGPAPQSTPAELPVGTTSKFKWYLERKVPAGETTIVRTGDGRITNESFLHWNNREYDVDSVLQLDADGYIVSQEIEGRGPFGSAIDEKFSIVGGVATWKTPGEGGSRTVDQPAFMCPTSAQPSVPTSRSCSAR